MTYSTHADVRRALAPDIVDPENPGPSTTPASLSNDTIDDAIAEADSRIDSYIGARYATPVAQVEGVVPEPIRFWSRDLAAYLCLLTWRKNQDVSPNDPVRLRAADIVADMAAVRAGTAPLDLPVNDTQVGQSGGALAPLNIGYSGNMFQPYEFDVGGSLWPSPRPVALDGLWHDRWL